MATYERRGARFIFKGLQLSRAIDDLDMAKYSIARNVRSYQEGVIQPRAGQNGYINVAVADLTLHSVKRLNNDITGAQSFCIAIGAGTNLYSDNATHTAFVARAAGFSGNPLTWVPFRPNDSPESFMYVGDSAKMGKLKTDGIFRNTGIFPPLRPPTGPGTTVPSLNSFQRVDIDDFIATAGPWIGDGTIIASPSNTTPVVFATTNVLYDSGITGQCSVGGPITPGILEGTLLILGQGLATQEVVLVEQVFKPLRNAVISSIAYDVGATGLCTIQLSGQARKRLVPNTLISIAGEVVRVLTVSIGADDQTSFRCSTTINHTVGQSIIGITSFRCSTVNSHGNVETIFYAGIFTSVISPNAGTGTMTRNVAIDLSSINGRPVQDNDEMNLLLGIDPSVIAEVQIMFDISVTPGQYKDYFIISVRPSDFSGSTGPSTGPDEIRTTLSTRESALQRQQIDTVPLDDDSASRRDRLQRRLMKAQQRGNLSRVERLQRRINELEGPPGGDPGGGEGEGGGGGRPGAPITVPTGVGALPVGPLGWNRIRVKISDIKRVGTDGTRDWANVGQLRFRVISTGLLPSSGIVSLNFSSWWIGGAFGPDTGDVGTPYIYRYRYRASESGAKSFPSPATRSGVLARRQRVQLVGTASADPQVDKIDWFRFGGSLDIWKYIGTGPNSTAQFNDDFPDDAIKSNPELEFDTFQPFPVAGAPINATCSVSGTTVTLTIGAISTAMAPGTQVIINGVPYTVYAPPSAVNKFEIVENAGALNGVSLFIPEPILMGTPLPSLWGPFGQGEQGTVMFACGDPNNPGVLYWTNPDDPDSASDFNFLEVTAPSEPLINGLMFDNKSWVFSSEDLYLTYPSQDLRNRLTFKAAKTGLGMGLAGRYFFCVGEGRIFFGTKDGIYATEGAVPISLTDADLFPLFPHDGIVGTPTNGVIPPDYAQPNFLRLAVGDSELRFDYRGTDGNFYTLMLNLITGAWVQDVYGRPVTLSYYEEGRATHRWLLGSTNGKLYLSGGTADDGINISGQIRTKSEDYGDPRAQKFFGDAILDVDPNNATVNAVLGFNNFTLAEAAIPVTGATRLEPPRILDVNGGAGRYARNIALDLSWTSALTPKLYLWEPSVIAKPEDTTTRVTDPDDAGIEKAKWFQGLRIRANTYGVDKSFKVQADNGPNGSFVDQPGATFILNSDGESVQAFSFPIPFIAHLVRIVGTDADPWSVIAVQWEFEPEPELVMTYKTQFGSLARQGYFHLRDIQIAHISTANITLNLNYPGGIVESYTIPHSSGLFTKDYIQLRARKAKLVQIHLVSTEGFRLYKLACETRVKSWDSLEPYATVQVFGDVHFLDGARV